MSFAALGVDPFPAAALSITLGSLEGARIEIAADSRDLPDGWLKDVSEDAPLFIKQVVASHNEAETLKELIRIGLPYAALVWNPLAKTIGEQAGKDIYVGIQQWLQKLWRKLKNLRDPIVSIQAYHHGCYVSFLLRGRDVELLYAAQASLPMAAVQAAKLIDTFALENPKLATLTYEFEQSRWFPSLAFLRTDASSLTAVFSSLTNRSPRLSAWDFFLERKTKRARKVATSHVWSFQTKVRQEENRQSL